MGCQGSLIMTFLSEPIYISTFVTPSFGSCIASLKRALIDRIPREKINMSGTVYRINEPVVAGTQLQFKSSKSSVQNGVPCGSSISWCDISEDGYDVIAKNGLRLGVIKKHRSVSKAESVVCRLQLFKLFKSVFAKWINLSAVTCSDTYQSCKTYRDFKKSLSYYKVWKNLRSSWFSHWVVHNEELDNFV